MHWFDFGGRPRENSLGLLSFLFAIALPLTFTPGPIAHAAPADLEVDRLTRIYPLDCNQERGSSPEAIAKARTALQGALLFSPRAEWLDASKLHVRLHFNVSLFGCIPGGDTIGRKPKAKSRESAGDTIAIGFHNDYGQLLQLIPGSVQNYTALDLTTLSDADLRTRLQNILSTAQATPDLSQWTRTLLIAGLKRAIEPGASNHVVHYSEAVIDLHLGYFLGQKHFQALDRGERVTKSLRAYVLHSVPYQLQIKFGKNAEAPTLQFMK